MYETPLTFISTCTRYYADRIECSHTSAGSWTRWTSARRIVQAGTSTAPTREGRHYGTKFADEGLRGEDITFAPHVRNIRRLSSCHQHACERRMASQPAGQPSSHFASQPAGPVLRLRARHPSRSTCCIREMPPTDRHIDDLFCKKKSRNSPAHDVERPPAFITRHRPRENSLAAVEKERQVPSCLPDLHVLCRIPPDP